ncbi:Neuropeptide-Like Protein [Caenorhabditis elegans]|uniref:Neuropeptide-Like Protein n=1 Tax=Caenorhabditis elegans TaxID=6239 RepID=A0A4V0IN19_CAEEL|nr:Neuropeptide-Like Protein [Caenorhabditis elegans]VTW47480.1 Neuropeptide-Like Protein [Caenorhabditis elegans]
MCNASVAVILLFVLCFHQTTSADFTDAESAIQVPRRSAEMYWVNRAMPNKYRKYRTYSVLQSIAPEDKMRYSQQLKMRLAQLSQH